MQYTFTQEQQQFRDVVRKFLKEKSPTSEVRRLMDTAAGYDVTVWQQMSQQLALPAISIPESYGGAGFGCVELSIAMEEMGRALLCSPYFSSVVLGANAILNTATEEQKQRLLPGIGSGEVLTTLAFTESDGSWNPSSIELLADVKGDQLILSGEKRFVVDGMTADKLLVAARLKQTSGEEGIVLALVDQAAQGLEKRSLETMDATRKLAHLGFNAVVAQPIGNDTREASIAGSRALSKTLDITAIALANEMVGGAQQLLDSTVAYTRLRMQFGRVIGSFQAIKHKCANMLLQLELARSAAYYAAAAVDADDPEVPILASMAKSAASDAYMLIAAEAIQIHGGIGFTWDQDTHLWFKRAKSSEVFLGDAAYHRELVMQRMELGL